MLFDNLIKFFLVSIVGAFVTYFLSSRRDVVARHEARLAALRDIHLKIDDLYRSTKHIKRLIRSRLIVGPNTDEYTIDAPFFAARMDELSMAQLKLEQVRNDVRNRSDLFENQQGERIVDAVSYSEEYLHDVVEEFEKRDVQKSGDIYRIGTTCENLADYLGPRWREGIEDELRTMERGATAEARYSAFEAIRQQVKRRRKSISDQCILLALRDIRDRITELMERRLSVWPSVRSLWRP